MGKVYITDPNNFVEKIAFCKSKFGEKQLDRIQMGLLLGVLLCSIDLFIFMPVPNCPDYRALNDS